jgi:hypothetical protein
MEATCVCGTRFAGETTVVEGALGRHQARCQKAIPFITRSRSIWDGPDDGSPEAFERWSMLVDMRLARGHGESAEKARQDLIAAGREDLLPK